MNPQARAQLTANMVRLADGDRTAFDPIFEETWPLVHRFASKMLGASAEAEDVAQHALMKVFNRAQEFDPKRDALSWILGITAFECKTSRQKVRRRKEELGGDEAFKDTRDASLTVEEQLIQSRTEEALSEVLNELSATERETILIAIHDLERPEIPAATFRKRLQRSMDRLREKWSEKSE